MGNHTTVHEKKRRGKWWIIPLAAVVLLAVAALFFFRSFLLVGGQIYRLDAAELDLREAAISTEHYRTLKEKMPACDIRWSVPIGGTAVDSRAESAVWVTCTEEDLQNASYLPELKELDLRQVSLTEKEYLAVRDRLPDCRVLWSIPIGTARYPSDAETVTLTDFSVEEIPLFARFEALKTADARNCTCYDAILALHETRPELELLWQVPISGELYPQDTREITVDSTLTSCAELKTLLDCLPALDTVSIPECSYSVEEQLSLAEEFPELHFLWPIRIAGKTFSGTDSDISLTDTHFSAEDFAQMCVLLRAFPDLKSVDLTGCNLTDEQVFMLCGTYPETDFVWDFVFCGVDVNTMDTQLDLSGHEEIGDLSRVEELFSCMHHLEKVDLSDCGFSDEALDALNKKYENVRVVWTIRIVYYKIRTDDVGFRATSSYYSYFTDETQERLKYCEDMLSLDLGHRPVSNLNFITGMTHLKYLCMLDCPATDLSPVGELKELVWLEMPRTYIKSIAPLVSCTALRDLNITWSRLESEEETFETLMQMPWLERVWFGHGELTEEHLAELRETYPDILYHEVFIYEFFCEDPWRFDQDYYDMRDLLGMFYMDRVTRINYKIIDGVRYELDPEFIANQGDTSHDEDRW